LHERERERERESIMQGIIVIRVVKKALVHLGLVGWEWDRGGNTSIYLVGMGNPLPLATSLSFPFDKTMGLQFQWAQLFQ